MRRLIALDGSQSPKAKTTTNEHRQAIEMGDIAKDGEVTECGSSKETTPEQRSELSHCLLPGCLLRERVGVSVFKSNGVVRAIAWWKGIRQGLKDLTSHSTFDVVIVTLIMLNTIVLASYYHGINPEFRQVLDYVNLVSERLN